MALGSRVNPALRRALPAIVLAVLAGHFAVLHWAATLPSTSSVLRPMAPPMYTRLIMPAAAPTPVAKPPAPVRKPRRKPAADRLQAAAPAPVASAPEVVAEAPREATPAPSETASPASPAASAPAAEPATAAASAASAAGAPVIAASPAESWPPDTRLRYRLGGTFRGGPLYGSARVLWQKSGTQYQARVEVDIPPFANFSMTSQGEIEPTTLSPRAYEETTNTRHRSVRFGEREVMLTDGRVLPRPDAVQDTASQFVELSHRFSSGRDALEVGKSVTMWMARPGGVDPWTYDVVERELLRTGLGEVEAFHLKPRMIAAPRGNITVEMWYAPTLQYLPVRIMVRMGAEAELDLLVEAIDQR